MEPPQHRPTEPTPHWAYVLAAKLRNRGVYSSAQDVRDWPPQTIRLAQVWVNSRETGRKVAPWAEYMGSELPPPSQHSWLPISASSQDLDRAGS
jgi:hypothetical protein